MSNNIIYENIKLNKIDIYNAEIKYTHNGKNYTSVNDRSNDRSTNTVIYDKYYIIKQCVEKINNFTLDIKANNKLCEKTEHIDFYFVFEYKNEKNENISFEIAMKNDYYELGQIHEYSNKLNTIMYEKYNNLIKNNEHKTAMKRLYSDMENYSKY
jgi:hypothetical protein